jgi:hypothetical protein
MIYSILKNDDDNYTGIVYPGTLNRKKREYGSILCSNE